MKYPDRTVLNFTVAFSTTVVHGPAKISLGELQCVDIGANLEQNPDFATQNNSYA